MLRTVVQVILDRRQHITITINDKHFTTAMDAIMAAPCTGYGAMVVVRTSVTGGIYAETRRKMSLFNTKDIYTQKSNKSLIHTL